MFITRRFFIITGIRSLMGGVGVRVAGRVVMTGCEHPRELREYCRYRLTSGVTQIRLCCGACDRPLGRSLPLALHPGWQSYRVVEARRTA